MKTASEALKHGNGTSYPMSIPEAITDSSHELWLLRVPRHSVLRECLVGKEIVVDDQTVQNSVRGNYAFRDASLTPAAQRIRPVVVGAESGGDMQLILGPSFKRQVDVTFTGSLVESVRGGPCAHAREYPEAPEGLSVKFCPVGIDSVNLELTNRQQTNRQQAAQERNRVALGRPDSRVASPISKGGKKRKKKNTSKSSKNKKVGST